MRRRLPSFATFPPPVGDQYEKMDRSLGSTCLTLFNSKAHDVDYFYASQLADESAPVYDVHYYPVEPLSERLTLKFTF
jgi:hypothetical protein